MSMNRTQFILIKIAEECAEVAQRALKAAQFGLDETQPDQPHANRHRLMGELTDLHAVLTMLEDADGFSYTCHADCDVQDKIDKVERYLELSQSLGMVEV